MSMVDYFYYGGMFMVPLTICSILALAIVCERFLYLRSAMKETDFALGQITELTRQGDVDGIETFCRQNEGLLTTVFLAGVRKFRQLKDDPNLDFVKQEASKMMEDASVLNTADLENRLPMLSTVGNVAPLFGFAGTVVGMMSAFEKIALTSNPSPQVVANGIREALITTATGLIIAIPVVLVYSYLTSQIDAMNTRTEETANELIDKMTMDHIKAHHGK